MCAIRSDRRRACCCGTHESKGQHRLFSGRTWKEWKIANGNADHGQAFSLVSRSCYYSRKVIVSALGLVAVQSSALMQIADDPWLSSGSSSAGDIPYVVFISLVKPFDAFSFIRAALYACRYPSAAHLKLMTDIQFAPGPSLCDDLQV